MRRIAAGAVEDTGGLFVTTPADDPDYADRFLAGCTEAGVPVQEISPAKALAREPRINPGISRAFEVQDGSVDAWQLLWGNAASARAHGATILTYHWVTAILRDGDRVAGAVARDDRGGEEVRIEAAFTVNASGIWAGEIADMAGCPGVTVVPGKGVMIAMNHRLVSTVVNRCEHPGDGDIIVPIHTVCVIGTTDEKADSPDDIDIARDHVQEMLDAGEVIVPGFRQARALHAWSGSRPLFKDERESEGDGDTRDMSRGLALVDHLRRDGVGGFLTITGGKLTTYRLMAETTVDAMCEQLGEARPCRTAEEALPGSEDGRTYWLGGRLAAREDDMAEDQLLCECELLPRRALVEAAEARSGMNLDDFRRLLRLGMGPCQGGYCTYRAAGILHGLGHTSARAGRRAGAHVPAAPLAGPRADPLRRPAAPGGPRRLDLPGHPRRGAPPRRAPLTPRMTRVVVVGAGLAGLAAAIRLAQGGASVTVVAKGAGGLHLSPGTIDVLGYAPERVDSLPETLPAFVAGRPDHPYARLAPEPLRGALDWFRELVPGLRYEGDPGRNMLLPTAVGAARPTALAPASIAAGDLRKGARLAVVGLRSLKDLYPGLVAENLSRADLPGGPVEARPVEVGWSARPGRADVAGPVHARGLDDPAERRRLAEELRPLVEPGETVLLPAVVGLERAAEAWDDLRELLGAPVAEVPTVPPCVPGMRLQRALTAALAEAGGRLVLGPDAVGVEVASGRVTGVGVRQAARVRELPADAVVLATGGFASGAIELDSRGGLRETVAGLPVRGPAPGDPRLSPRHLDDQPLMRSGVAVDDRMRPVDDDGAAGLGQPLRGRGARGRRRALAREVGRGHLPGRRRRGRICDPRGGPMSDPTVQAMIRDSLDHCVKCTICETFCPVAAATPLFPGPKYVGPQAERYRSPDGPSPDRSLDYCSSCGICTQVCPQGVKIAEINSQARALMKADRGIPLRDRLIARPTLIGPPRRSGRADRQLDHAQPAHPLSGRADARHPPLGADATLGRAHAPVLGPPHGPAATPRAGRAQHRGVLPRLRRQLLRARHGPTGRRGAGAQRAGRDHPPPGVLRAAAAEQRHLRRRTPLRPQPCRPARALRARRARHRRHLHELRPDAQARGRGDPGRRGRGPRGRAQPSLRHLRVPGPAARARRPADRLPTARPGRPLPRALPAARPRHRHARPRPDGPGAGARGDPGRTRPAAASRAPTASSARSTRSAWPSGSGCSMGCAPPAPTRRSATPRPAAGRSATPPASRPSIPSRSSTAPTG